MGLTNTQYDAIMRCYSQKQADNQRALEQRRKTAYKQIPQFVQLDSEVASCSLSCARALLEDAAADIPTLKKKLAACADERIRLLKEHGFPADYLEMHYTCPDCQDTGYIEGKKCHCFRQAAIDLFYTQSGLKEILQEENFQHFSYDYYPETLIHPATGKNARETMRTTVAACLRYID